MDHAADPPSPDPAATDQAPTETLAVDGADGDIDGGLDLADAGMNDGTDGGLDGGPASAEFRNEPVQVEDLPRLSDHRFEPLDPAYLRVRQIGSAIFAAIVLIAAVVAVVVIPIPNWVPLAAGGALLGLTALGAFLQWLEVNNLGYLVREKDFSFRRGVIGRSVATVPFARVQHVSIQRGPLERRFGLATLEMKTAGDDIHVPGMSADTAARLKDLVVDRAGAVADEEFEIRDR